jgi:hypothetical protein
MTSRISNSQADPGEYLADVGFNVGERTDLNASDCYRISNIMVVGLLFRTISSFTDFSLRNC